MKQHCTPQFNTLFIHGNENFMISYSFSPSAFKNYWKTSQNIAQENSACAVEEANDPQLKIFHAEHKLNYCKSRSYRTTSLSKLNPSSTGVW